LERRPANPAAPNVSANSHAEDTDDSVVRGGDKLQLPPDDCLETQTFKDSQLLGPQSLESLQERSTVIRSYLAGSSPSANMPAQLTVLTQKERCSQLSPEPQSVSVSHGLGLQYGPPWQDAGLEPFGQSSGGAPTTSAATFDVASKAVRSRGASDRRTVRLCTHSWRSSSRRSREFSPA
jgi:hypothetical protein